MDPRDSFNADRDPDRFDADTAADLAEPPPDGIRNAGATQVVPGAEARTDAGETPEAGSGTEDQAGPA